MTAAVPALRSQPETIAELCRAATAERERFFARLLPPEFLEHYGLAEPRLWRDDGAGVLRWLASSAEGILRLEVWPEPAGDDPALALELADTRDRQMEAGWIVINDIAGPRYHLDRAGDGSPLAIGDHRRNLGEELRALAAGLAPNQVRPGLRLFRPVIQRIEALARELGKDKLYVVPLAYHNAIKYEHYGFGYVGDSGTLHWIDREFRPGGCLRRSMDGTRPFRLPWMADTIRGRSWAIRDGVLGHHWAAPRMVKNLFAAGAEDTFPGGRW